MAFKYEEVRPWGRSFEEYERMFDLGPADLGRTILGWADGPASFNAQMFRHGRRVVSCDPLYQFSAAQISERVDATYESVMGQTRLNQDKFLWDVISSPHELGRVRMAAMNDFLADYDNGKKQGRYLMAQLPDLPFPAGAFDLALCSHFLFLYEDALGLTFHKQAVDEMCRVAREVRLFPLLTYNGDPSSLVTPVIEHVQHSGLTASIQKVPYQFQRGGNMMMLISGNLHGRLNHGH
jgi:hypothetical protein